jgi:hypothetical protein
MKKSLVALLLVLGLVTVGHSAFAVATAVDFDAALTLLSQQPILGASWAPAVADSDDNNVLDSYELRVVQTALGNASDANHAAVYTAFATNSAVLAQVKTALMANATFLALFSANPGGVADALNLLANGLTICGDQAKVDAVKGMWHTLMIPDATGTALMNAMVKVPAVFGEGGNFDGDTYTNKQEALLATSAADYVTRVYRNDPPPSLSVTVAKTPAGAIVSGSSVTLTATPADGTAPYSYVWKKNGVAVGGQTAATYTFAALAGSNSYTCEVMDSVSPQAVASAPVVVNALDSATLPVMGVAGIALLAGLAGALGVRKIRK